MQPGPSSGGAPPRCRAQGLQELSVADNLPLTQLPPDLAAMSGLRKASHCAAHNLLPPASSAALLSSYAGVGLRL